MRELENFVRLSKYAGERFDLIQAGGGNSSVKLDGGTMIIKASGFMLSEVERNKGHVLVKNDKVAAILEDEHIKGLKNREARDKSVSKLLKKALLGSDERPSIEIFLHSLLNKYTLHTHPIAVNAVICRKGGRAIFEKLFKGEAAYVDYGTPGLEVALRLKSAIELYMTRHGVLPKIVFLENHGLIVSAPDLEEVINITEGVLYRLERYLEIDLSKYKLTNKISGLVNAVFNNRLISNLSTDKEIYDFYAKKKRRYFFNSPFCPDGLVYCGARAVGIKNVNDDKPIREYKRKFGEAPRVVIYGRLVFFVAKNLRKTKEIEDVFRAHILVLKSGKAEMKLLKKRELSYLSNWESEKYRRG